jgi:acyl carrier protein
MVETRNDGPTTTEIQNWLASKIAALLEVSLQEIDIQEDLDFYGLESVEAITLSGELSDWVGRDLSPTIVREYPTIADIARYLTEGE